MVRRCEGARVRGCACALIVFALALLAAAPLSAQTRTDDSRLSFEAVSIKPSRTPDAPGMTAPPGRFTATNMWLRFVIQNAYGVRDDQITGGPGWLTTDRFDIVATTGSRAGQQQVMGMLRSMLEDRFKLRAHMETREELIYALVRARNDGKLGPEIRPSTVDCSVDRDRCRTETSGGRAGLTMRFVSMPMDRLASQLRQMINRPVNDETGLAGTFDLSLTFIPENMKGPMAEQWASAGGTSMFTAVQEQLGLKLEARRGPVELLVIDSVERPTED